MHIKYKKPRKGRKLELPRQLIRPVFAKDLIRVGMDL